MMTPCELHPLIAELEADFKAVWYRGEVVLGCALRCMILLGCSVTARHQRGKRVKETRDKDY
jgi:hypothetical protein